MVAGHLTLERSFIMGQNSVRVAVTGAAGQIGYALLFRIASGQMFGPNTDVHLNLIELEPALGGLAGGRYGVRRQCLSAPKICDADGRSERRL